MFEESNNNNNSNSSSSSNSNSNSKECNDNVSSIHLLPCAIDYNGPAPINTFFKINKINTNTFEAQIRGRGLVGKEIDLSDLCKGLCVSDDKTKVIVEGEFNSFIYWQHGMEPDVQQLESSLSWFEIAKDLHS